MTKTLRLLPAALFCLCLSPMLGASESVTVGVIKQTLTGGKINVCSTPFVGSPVLTFTASEVNGQVVSTGTANASAIVPADNYAEIVASDGVKELSYISAVSATSITLTDATSVAVGNQVIVRPIPTLNSLLGSANTFGFLASSTGKPNPKDADLVMIFNRNAQSSATYFYCTYPGHVGWVNATTLRAAGNVQIEPGTGLVFKVVGANVAVFFSGEVQDKPVETRVVHGINLMAVSNPLVGTYEGRMLTLNGSGLFDGDDAYGVRPSPNTVFKTADWIYIFNPAAQTLSTHFYSTYTGHVGWNNTTTGRLSGTTVFSAGTGFYLIRRGDAFYWTQPVDYLGE